MLEIFRLKLTIPSGIVLVALVLHFFVAVSLPFIQAVYIVESSFYSNNTKQDVVIGISQNVTQIRVSLAKL
jgi:hypothetical protein